MVVLDDLADQFADIVRAQYLPSLTDHKIHKKISKLPVDLTTAEADYILYTAKIWDLIFVHLKKLERYKDYEGKILEYYQYLMDTMVYSLDIRRNPEKISFQKNHEIFSHNMHIIIWSKRPSLLVIRLMSGA